MKLFAHRGWSKGKIENTILGFKNTVGAKLDGVEFDISFDRKEQTVIVSHDRTNDPSVLRLDEALEYLQTTDLELLIEFKEYSDKLYEIVVDNLDKYNLLSRSTIFAFYDIARSFPWDNRKNIKLGIIAPYPRNIRAYIESYKPDMVLMGWGTKSERLQFKIVWTFLSLKKIILKYPSTKFIIGVMYTDNDKKWLLKQTGLYGATADFPLAK